MRRLRWLPLAVLAFAAAEFAVFVWVGRLIGFGPALLALLALSVLGLVLVRREGLRAWRRLRAGQGTGPVGDDVLDGVVGLLAALLLAIPGFVGAVAGLALLAVPLRGAARAGLRRYTERRVPSGVAGNLFGPRQAKVRRADGHPPADTSSSEVIEGEIVD